MAESAGKQLLSALTEGHEKGNSKSTSVNKGSKTSSVKAGKSRNSRSGQTSSKCNLKLHNYWVTKNLNVSFYF